jgi:hypothetical protein
MFDFKGAMHTPDAVIAVIIASDFSDCGKYYGIPISYTSQTVGG